MAAPRHSRVLLHCDSDAPIQAGESATAVVMRWLRGAGTVYLSKNGVHQIQLWLPLHSSKERVLGVAGTNSLAPKSKFADSFIDSYFPTTSVITGVQLRAAFSFSWDLPVASRRWNWRAERRRRRPSG